MPVRKRWVIPLGSVAGIRIDLHTTFLLLLAWVAIASWSKGAGIVGGLEGVLLVIAVFATVVVHELAHALTARRFGIRTRDITLYPIGGIASLERMPDRPVEELLVAAVGPAVNVAVAGLLWMVLSLSGADTSIATLDGATGGFGARLMWINVSLAVFNLTPAFPLDGGRILRAVLCLRMDRARATSAAAWAGQAMALVIAAVGWFVNPWLLLIAAFIWYGARQESALEQLKASLRGVPVSEAMITDFGILAPQDTLAGATDRIVHGFQRDFLVVERHRVVGLITHADILRGLERAGPESRVDAHARTDIEVASSTQMLDELTDRLRVQTAPMVVLQGPEIRGLLTLDGVERWLLMRRAGLRGGDLRAAAQLH